MLQGYLSTTSLRVPTRINKITTYYNITTSSSSIAVMTCNHLREKTLTLKSRRWNLHFQCSLQLTTGTSHFQPWQHCCSSHDGFSFFVIRFLFHELVLLQEGRCSCSHAETTNVQAALLGFFAPWQAEDVFCNLSQGATGCTMLRLMIWGKLLSFWPLCGRKKRLT